MSDKLQDDLIYKHVMTFSHEELAGMYTIINKREQEHLEEIEALNLSCSTMVEINCKQERQFHQDIKKLEKENARLRDVVKGNIAVMGKMQERENKMIKLEKENARLREALESLKLTMDEERMGKLTKEEISWYLKYNCTLETLPRCSKCYTQNDDIYTDELDGEMFCKECLIDSLNNDEVALKELRSYMKIETLKGGEE